MIKQTKADNIKAWREVLVQLDNQKFFELMRMYLGKIETPFNKQKLIERLSAFLRRPNIKEKIITGLDSFDTAVVTAISFLPVATEEVLHGFFYDDYSFSTLYEKLRNLEERLLIYKKNTKSDGCIYKINPHLEQEILKTVNIDIFCLPEKIGESKNLPLIIDNIQIAGVYSFLIHNPSMLKLNGEIKKKFLTKFYSAFPDFSDSENSISLLIYAFINLGLFIRADTGLVANEKKWRAFSTLSPYEIKSYITVAATGKYRKKFLHSKTKAFYKFISSLQPTGEYQKSDLEKTFFLYMETVKVNFTKHETVKIADSNESYSKDYKNMSIIDIAKTFGIFYEKNGLFTLNGNFKNDEFVSEEPLLVSPAFEVTIFPSTKLSRLLNILTTMEPVSIQTTGRFEINRKAAGFAFQENLTAKKLCEILKTESKNKLPQNVEVSIMQWYKSFSSVQLYKGVIAVVSPEKQRLFEKSTELSEIVHSKIKEGVYLLKDNSYEQIKSSRLDFLFHESNTPQPFSQTRFESIPLYDEKKQSALTKSNWKKEIQEKQKKYFTNFENLKNKVDSLNLDADAKQSMLDAISRRVIIDETQIQKENIQSSKVEISGLDFLGKIRLCEKAITEKSMLELSFSDNNKAKTLLCLPIKIIRTEKNALLQIRAKQEKKIKQISIAHILKIKLIKSSIFS
ncbi:MAG: hypothetical protein CR988_05800 [Treponema sp.]|nr:MAG: hypothetical protein CR988_05800 [Treponema sp.]